MTTENAKEKQCRVFPNTAQMSGACGGMTFLDYIPSKCCADECMHWRWESVEVKHEGYCGLCGRQGAE